MTMHPLGHNKEAFKFDTVSHFYELENCYRVTWNKSEQDFGDCKSEREDYAHIIYLETSQTWTVYEHHNETFEYKVR